MSTPYDPIKNFMINLPVKAEWQEGKGIVIVDAKGNPIKATYGATADNRTCYGEIPGLGFFGWQWPSPPLPFKTLVDCINAAKFYRTTAELPQIGGRNSRGSRRHGYWERK